MTQRPDRPQQDALYELALGDPVQAKLYVHKVLNSEQGRFLLWWLKQYVAYGQPMHQAGDPHTSAYLSGRQDPVHLLVTLAAADPETLTAEAKQPQTPAGPSKAGFDLFSKGDPHGQQEERHPDASVAPHRTV